MYSVFGLSISKSKIKKLAGHFVVFVLIFSFYFTISIKKIYLLESVVEKITNNRNYFVSNPLIYRDNLIRYESYGEDFYYGSTINPISSKLYENHFNEKTSNWDEFTRASKQ